MNYLAHAWLARHSDDALLGGLLGDFVFGQSALQDWPEPIRAEIVRHRRIDRYTDDHPAVVAARTRFGPLRPCPTRKPRPSKRRIMPPSSRRTSA